ncbi:hypothetical protein CC2G_005119 [Coprinopsis cinerea AmutBmut pab1-1]|nr:hypothetical protein CC2G_005119 [Coprinopsis cinerea AmutBmut pab1-1]
MDQQDDFMKMKAQLESTQLNIIVSVASMTLLVGGSLAMARGGSSLVRSLGNREDRIFHQPIPPIRCNSLHILLGVPVHPPLSVRADLLQLADNFVVRPSPLLCKIIFSIPCIGIAMCILISEVILYVRVYALAGRGRLMLTFMIVHGLAVFVASISLLGKYVVLGSWGQSQFADIVPGCVGKFTTNGELVMIAYVVLLYSGFVVMILCVYFGLRIYWRSRRSPLIKIFYRDGTFYFVVLAVMSIANGVSAQFLPVRGLALLPSIM